MSFVSIFPIGEGILASILKASLGVALLALSSLRQLTGGSVHLYVSYNISSDLKNSYQHPLLFHIFALHFFFCNCHQLYKKT